MSNHENAEKDEKSRENDKNLEKMSENSERNGENDRDNNRRDSHSERYRDSHRHGDEGRKRERRDEERENDRSRRDSRRERDGRRNEEREERRDYKRDERREDGRDEKRDRNGRDRDERRGDRRDDRRDERRESRRENEREERRERSGRDGNYYQSNGNNELGSWEHYSTTDREEGYLEFRKNLRTSIRDHSSVWGRSPSPPPNFGEELSESEGEDEKRIKRIERQKENIRNNRRDSGSESEEDRKQKKRRKEKKEKREKKQKKDKKKKRHSSSSDEEEEAQDWVVKEVVIPEYKPDLSNVPVGPQPLPKLEHKTADFGSALLPGEGDAIAQFVLNNQRIPRRGEIGLTSDEIEKYEGAGFVMSGSRHKRMTAVRLRKEGQVISAEERRQLALKNFEERAKKENQVIADLRTLVNSKLEQTENKQ
eukprot:TRINITY_DN3935_c0_g1_i1.p1 TRINITY_DN3935_c0_g1~~TRINITY_DN3935_c0_g1_i1.p1  ORF type:complete len:425 (-),score=213.85 TRINITY_DN3935_c0_g1_i1:471-1745(-)